MNGASTAPTAELQDSCAFAYSFAGPGEEFFNRSMSNLADGAGPLDEVGCSIIEFRDISTSQFASRYIGLAGGEID